MLLLLLPSSNPNRSSSTTEKSWEKSVVLLSWLAEPIIKHSADIAQTFLLAFHLYV
jgi:hypothetical protein